MKKILLIALTAVIVVGCTFHDNQDISNKIITLDSCEYIQYWSGYYCTGIEHKGNCRYCTERRKAEIREIVELLNDK